MAKDTKKHPREYRFKIDAYSPTRMPMSLLAEFLSDLATIFGEEQRVHLIRIENGSHVNVVQVEKEADIKVRERIKSAACSEGPADILNAVAKINERLRQHNAQGQIYSPTNGKLLHFPGVTRQVALEYGPFTQHGTLEGVPVKIGGYAELVPIHLAVEGSEKHICQAKRSLAKEIAAHLFTSTIRVEGKGRWVRRETGEWEMKTFTVSDFNVISDAKLIDELKQLRQIPASWKKLDDPLAALGVIRHDMEIQ